MMGMAYINFSGKDNKNCNLEGVCHRNSQYMISWLCAKLHIWHQAEILHFVLRPTCLHYSIKQSMPSFKGNSTPKITWALSKDLASLGSKYKSHVNQTSTSKVIDISIFESPVKKTMEKWQCFDDGSARMSAFAQMLSHN